MSQPKATLRQVLWFLASGTLGWATFLSAGLVGDFDLLIQVIACLPGLIFAVALGRAGGFRVSVIAAALVTGGWYGAFLSAMRIVGVHDTWDMVFLAGAVGGAIGGLAVGLAHCLQRRRFATGLVWPALLSGTIFGTIALPASGLSEGPVPISFEYLYLTFIIWQVGVGQVFLATDRGHAVPATAGP